MSAFTPGAISTTNRSLNSILIALIALFSPSILLGQVPGQQPPPPPPPHDPLPDYLTPGKGWEPDFTWVGPDGTHVHVHPAINADWLPDPRDPHMFRLVRRKARPKVDIVEFPDPARIERRGTFAWLAWWEVNRDAYLKPRLPGNVQLSDLLVAMDALIRAAHSTNPTIRAEAALALGRLKQDRALETLVELIQDKDDIVRLRAWAAMGLIDSPRVMEFLLAKAPTSPQEQIGWTLAAGLLSKPNDQIWRQLRALASDDRNPEAQRLAVWAARTHPAPENRELLLDVANSTRSLFILREALIGLGDVPDDSDLRRLASILRWNTEGGGTPFIDALIAVSPATDAPRGPARGSPPKPTPELSAALGEKPTLVNAAASASGRHTVDSADKDMVAALSIGLVPAVGRGARGATTPSPLPPLPVTSERGERLIALGRLNHPTGNRMLVDGFDLFAMRDPENPCRAFSALALGLSLRTGDKAQFDPLFRLHRVFDHIEPGTPKSELVYDVRVASALAMGLADHPESRVKMKISLGSLKEGQDLSLGYILLALGMLGDSDVLAFAQSYLGPAVPAGINGEALATAYPMNSTDFGSDELMTRRAIVQGLAAQGDAKSLPLLMGEWGKDDALSLEVARALSWCRRPLELQPTTRPLLDLDSDQANRALLDAYIDSMCRLAAAKDAPPHLAASAVASLGILYEQDDTRTRLAGLIVNTDFATSMQPADARKMNLTYKYSKIAYPQQQIFALVNPFYYLSMRVPPFHPN